MDRAVLCLPVDTPLSAVLLAMAEGNRSCVLAVAPDGRLAGIMTERDIARRIAFRLPPEAPLAAVMTTPAMSVRDDDYLYRAVSRLRRHDFRHLPVVDADGRPVGVIDFRQVLHAVAESMLLHIDRVGAGTDVDSLANAKRAQAALAGAMLDDGVPATDAIGIVNEINRDLHRRALQAALAKHGPPPAPFTLVVMGSLGRGESLLVPDQDNGFLLADGAEAHDDWYADLAATFTTMLDSIGFPFCKGGVMATSRQWRKPAMAWRDDALNWIASRSGTAILNADIFFDFDVVAGDAVTVAELRRPILEALRQTPAFIAELAAETLRHPVGVTWFNKLRRDRDGRVDLKLFGLLPLVGAVRLYALAHGVAATGTRPRLAALAGLGVLPAAETGNLSTAFELLAGRILRQQIDDSLAGRPLGTFVSVAALPAREHEHLVEALRSIALLATRARGDFMGRLI